MAAVVPAVDERADLGVEVFHGAEGAAADGLSVDDPEPDFDEVHPRCGRAPLRWPIRGVRSRGGWLSDNGRKAFEGHAEACITGFVGRDLVMAAAHVLHERMTRGHRPG